MKHSKLIVLLFLFFVIVDFNIFVTPIKPSTILYIIIYAGSFILIFLALNSTEFTNLPPSFKTLFKLYWLYSFIIIVYGLLRSDSYWDYKFIFIIYIPAVIISLSIFMGIKYQENLNLFKFIIKIVFPLALFFSFFVWNFAAWSDYYQIISRMSTPIFFFILAFPFLKVKHQWLVFFLSIACIVIGLEWRANVFRITACWIIVLFYYLPLLKPRIINLVTFFIFSIPLIFLYLGVEGSLDIFQFISESKVEIPVDKGNSRTSLYQEVLWSIQDRGTNLLFGGGASEGYLSTVWSDPYWAVGNKGRQSIEVAFLYTLFKSGIIGIIFDMLIFFIPAYFAINRSNNNFTKMLGLYLFLSWLLYFVAVPQGFNVRFFFHYLIVGLCLTKSFRLSTDTEIKSFFKSI